MYVSITVGVTAAATVTPFKGILKGANPWRGVPIMIGQANPLMTDFKTYSYTHLKGVIVSAQARRKERHEEICQYIIITIGI